MSGEDRKKMTFDPGCLYDFKLQSTKDESVLLSGEEPPAVAGATVTASVMKSGDSAPSSVTLTTDARGIYAVETTAAADGSWSVQLAPLATSCEGRTLTANDAAVNDGFIWSERLWGNIRLKPLEMQ